MPESSEPAPTPALATFSLIAGPRSGETLPILAPVVTIGQGPQNDLVLADDSVSKTHARLEFILDGWRLTDLESTNGTTVEGVRLAAGVPTPLAYGSSVRFGGVRLVFREVEEADPAAASASFSPAAAEAPAKPRHFRLPVWLFLVILLVMAALAFLLFGVMDVGAALP
jgi:pSer/pThr/pTyr-binding forkhead associated (FHA) protein